ncbi:MAG: phosphatase PAP2 family protein [Gemmatimonadota bacterium]|nr:phosphatase PAP2 family protein [Gemmatimonadota bacterium]
MRPQTSPVDGRALYEAAPFVGLVAVYVAVGVLILGRIDRPPSLSLATTYGWPALLAGIYLLVTFVGAIGIHVFAGRRRPSDPETWRFVYGRWLGSDRLVGMLVVLATFPALLDVMYGFRLALTAFQPFYLDPVLARTDAFLHGGSAPWELLQPLVGHPGITRFIDTVYVYGWFAVLWLGVIWQTIHGREPVRSQFLMTFALAWIVLGTAVAILTSSAGPAFFARVTGLEDPFAGLMAYLAAVDQQAPLRAVANQERLWTSYTEWGGMTAMPSMHLSIVTAVVLAGIQTYRWLSWVLIPFGFVILIGSVHLGWHYAIDSYVGILATVWIWWASGHFVRWWQQRKSFAEVPDEA